MKLRFVFFLLLALCSCSHTPAEKEMATYRIGYMICNSERETLQRFIPMTAYLGKRLGVKFEAVAIDTIDFTKQIDSLDFIHTNSLLYIILNRYNGVEILGAEKKGSLGRYSKGVIAVLKKSGITRLEELRGKTMIFGPMLAPTGFMSQIDVLQQNGLDPDADLTYYTIPSGSFKHEKAIYGVLFERYDAGSFPLDDLESMAADNRINLEDFQVIAEGPAIPYCNFAATQKVDEKFAARFKDVLLEMNGEETVEIDGEVLRVLERAQVQGYDAIKDADFDIVRQMAKRTNMPPYQTY